MSDRKRCKHGMVVCSQCVIVTDAAKRITDQINARITFTPFDELKNGWMAFRLADGSGDGVVYPSRADAIFHQHGMEKLCAFVSFRALMGGANAKDMQLWLDVQRDAYEAGLDFHEPEAPQLILPQQRGVGRWPM
jgi:hypothetical protein